MQLTECIRVANNGDKNVMKRIIDGMPRDQLKDTVKAMSSNSNVDYRMKYIAKILFSQSYEFLACVEREMPLARNAMTTCIEIILMSTMADEKGLISWSQLHDMMMDSLTNSVPQAGGSTAGSSNTQGLA
jgi:hypothetical protein